MPRTFCYCLVATLLFVTADRLPAPISEVPDNPTPAATPKSKPKPKPKPEASESTKTAVKQQPTPKQSRFAGTWVGTIPAFPTGPQDTILTVDPKEATMSHTWVGHPPTQVAKAEIFGDTIRATFHTDVTFTFSLTPMSDGVTASVRLQAFLNNNKAVFRRTTP